MLQQRSTVDRRRVDRIDDTQPLVLCHRRPAAAAADLPELALTAANEDLLRLRSADPLVLLQVAYHLGNRHEALQNLPGELRLLADPVLERLLRDRGLAPEVLRAPFAPEAGAYDDHGGGHRHDHDNRHDHGHPHDH
jgi:urease accessory protein